MQDGDYRALNPEQRALLCEGLCVLALVPTLIKPALAWGTREDAPEDMKFEPVEGRDGQTFEGLAAEGTK